MEVNIQQQKLSNKSCLSRRDTSAEFNQKSLRRSEDQLANYLNYLIIPIISKSIHRSRNFFLPKMFTSARRIFWMLFQVSTALTSNVTSATSLKIIGQLRADYWRKNLNFSRNKLYTFVLTYPPNLNTVGRTQQQISPKTYCPQRTYPPAYVLSLGSHY